ncbi:MAG: dTDP-4-dehydrorhamnose 3,5-epimerase [Candidatus Rokubacteria bacterium]|nr:dTDP-4-dehydrorhamnose 3,5-epimerase [Candidatus Rokubacteria bacterium]
MDLSPQAKRVFEMQSYAPRPAIEGVQIVELKRFHDDGGSMTELARLVDGAPEGLSGFTLRQINFSEIEPGAIKAFHLHTRQTDVWFVPPSDRVLLVLVDVRKGSRTEGATMRLVLGSGAARLVRIPPGVAHGARNLGPATARIIYFTDLHFSPDPSDCDEGRLPWDYLGADVWDVTRG